MKAKRSERRISFAEPTRVAIIIDTPSHEITTDLMTTEEAMVKLREFHRLVYHPAQECIHGKERDGLLTEGDEASVKRKILFPKFGSSKT